MNRYGPLFTHKCMHLCINFVLFLLLHCTIFTVAWPQESVVSIKLQLFGYIIKPSYNKWTNIFRQSFFVCMIMSMCLHVIWWNIGTFFFRFEILLLLLLIQLFVCLIFFPHFLNFIRISVVSHVILAIFIVLHSSFQMYTKFKCLN